MSQFPFPSHLFSFFNVSVFYVWETFFIHFLKFVGSYLSIAGYIRNGVKQT